jgi:threonine synthase
MITKEFILSEKIHIQFDFKGNDLTGIEVIKASNVKEFLRLLKERLTNGFAYLSEEDTIAIINELAGNKLIEEKK